jgi:hypothetical protein
MSPKIYVIYQSEDKTELSFFPKDHPNADFLKLSTDGEPQTLVLEFLAPSVSFARAVYKAYCDDPQIAHRLLKASIGCSV